MRWLDRQGIELTGNNYFPFYSVYALMFGPNAGALFGGRRILVVTSTTPEKRKGLELGLRRRGARDVQYLEVSPTRAMFDRLDIGRIRRPVELVLIGAGVGSAAVLGQVRSLGAVAIDAGFALDAIAFPAKRWNRPYCVPDAEFDVRQINFLGLEDIAMHRRILVGRGEASSLLNQIESIVRARTRQQQMATRVEGGKGEVVG
jgi:hypothetical protein